MTINKNVVLLLKAQKSEETEDKYEIILNKNNFKVVQLKTIEFNFINLDALKEKLNNPDAYQGIIFSSPRCVYAIEKALNGSALDLKWKEKCNYVVGEATYKDALDILELDCIGKDSGNGDNLAKIIINDHKNGPKQFLMPCGNLKSDTIQSHLEKCKLSVDPITVYETIPNPNLPKEFEDVTRSFEALPEIVVFFSPSGVKAFAECLRNFENEIASIKFIPIGPTTNKAMEGLGIPVHAVAQKPNPEELLKAILK